jgi:transcriptional regulator with XRE-family HTH domain/DNA polymerase III delta prime subunit
MNKEKKVNTSLRRARIEHGWTQKQLANEIGVAESTVRSWEQYTRSPGPELLARLSKALGKSPIELDLFPLPESTDTFHAQHIQEEGNPPLSTEVIVRDQWPTRPHTFLISPTEKNRQRMIQRVQSRWITGFLDKVPFHNDVLMDLHVGVRFNVVASPWRTKNQEPYPSGLQPHSIPIREAYDQADGELLILGEPGAGKTTLLLELIRDLLERCKIDEAFPIPVIFNLSAWAVHKAPFADWLISELHFTYQVPVKLAQTWISNDQILPLLDGLDEVLLQARPACVLAINEYRQEHGLIPLVICCRTSDYEILSERLVLNMAVEIQPLTLQQIDEYISHQKDLAAMQLAIRADQDLQEIVSTPLMLTILAYSTQGMSPQEIQSFAESSRYVVLTQYIERLLRKEVTHHYTPAQTKQWLSWLAWEMQQHNQVAFYLDRIQPDWLESRRHQYQKTVVRLIIILQCLVTGALTAWLKGGLKHGVVGSGNGILGLFGGGEGNSMMGWMAPGIGGGTQGGASLIIILGIVVWLVTILVASPEIPKLTFQAIRHGLFKGLRAGIILGIIISALAIPFFSRVNLVHGWNGNGILYGLGIGFFLGICGGLLHGLGAGLRYEQKIPKDASSFKDHLLDGLILGTAGGLSFMAVGALLRVSLQSTLIYSVITFFFYFFAYGFGQGMRLFPALIHMHIQPAEKVTWSWGKMMQDMPENSMRSLLLAIVTCLSVGTVVAGVSSSFFLDIPYGLHYGLVYGTISGLIVGVAALLTSMITSGWFSDMLSEDQHIRPNEGIIRSGRNALLSACVFAPIGALASGIACGVGFGLVGGLTTWPVMAKAFFVMFVIMFFVIFATAQGGIAWVEHYVLRGYLYRTHKLPLNGVKFLNSASDLSLLRKVGGSYMFTHRLIQDYFAHLYQTDTHA